MNRQQITAFFATMNDWMNQDFRSIFWIYGISLLINGLLAVVFAVVGDMYSAFLATPVIAVFWCGFLSLSARALAKDAQSAGEAMVLGSRLSEIDELYHQVRKTHHSSSLSEETTSPLWTRLRELQEREAEFVFSRFLESARVRPGEGERILAEARLQLSHEST